MRERDVLQMSFVFQTVRVGGEMVVLFTAVESTGV